MPVTVSIGCATVSDPSCDAVELLRTADSVLYRAKAAGRNCVITAVDADR